jgi:nucleotidyltransferase substrate binding protein (TIGR01987 family)
MKINTEPLINAITRLEEGLVAYECDKSRSLIRDGLIHRFEFTYEVVHKTLKRYLEAVSPTPEAYDTMPFQDLIRSGNEAGLLLRDWPTWKGYRDMRAKTSHTYNEDIALKVVAGIPAFIEEARYLRDSLHKRVHE